MHKVFISFHHTNDQSYRHSLVQYGERNKIFLDRSVDTGEISDKLSDDEIRQKIRDEYLRDSTVTILLVGTQTAERKHVDWELYSSMFDGKVNKRSGIVVINLPTIDNGSAYAPYGSEEKQIVHPGVTNWTTWNSRREWENVFPHMPVRIIDNLESGAPISVVGWDKLNAQRLSFLLDCAYKSRLSAQYDFRTPMKRRNG